jgi:hypothetical protein
MEFPSRNITVLAAAMVVGLIGLGTTLGNSIIRFKELDRTVNVKGLSEKEVEANIALWPINFSAASNDLTQFYATLDKNADTVKAFLKKQGFADSEISVSPPNVTDKLAQQWGGGERAEFRYTGNRGVTVYTTDIAKVRTALNNLSVLGKAGITLSSGDNGGGSRPQYLFTKLNEIKPKMIEEATQKGRQVAEKFATDSGSRLGKIKNADQGLFSVEDRDQENQHLKTVRVVSSIEYYLTD